MDFRIVDYSATFFPGELPASRQGKFLQLVRDGETELLVLSPYGQSKFHAQILERYCMLNGIEGRFVRKPELFATAGTDVEVVGGGHWSLDEPDARLLLFGESKVYGRFDAEGLPEKVRGLPEYARYRVVVE